jgi:OHCU decarboxylase
MKTTLQTLNACSIAEFVAVCGTFFESSPWIAERAAVRRPFRDRDQMLAAMRAVVDEADIEERLSLVRAHPDLAGRAARAGLLTAESTREQAAAGLESLSRAEAQQMHDWNTAYRDKFGFPFVICARENKKDAILAAFPVRLAATREAELDTALGEIAKIARLRMLDAVEGE